MGERAAAPVMRNTMQRRLVLETVRASCIHPSASEVYSSIQQEHPGISRATVYRNLHTLVELGEIRCVKIPGDADRYDKTLEEHAHIKCRVCGCVSDIDMPDADILALIGDSYGFTVEGYELAFEGLCPECRSR